MTAQFGRNKDKSIDWENYNSNFPVSGQVTIKLVNLPALRLLIDEREKISLPKGGGGVQTKILKKKQGTSLLPFQMSPSQGGGLYRCKNGP